MSPGNQLIEIAGIVINSSITLMYEVIATKSRRTRKKKSAPLFYSLPSPYHLSFI
jgi:hypothetical protein